MLSVLLGAALIRIAIAYIKSVCAAGAETKFRWQFLVANAGGRLSGPRCSASAEYFGKLLFQLHSAFAVVIFVFALGLFFGLGYIVRRSPRRVSTAPAQLPSFGKLVRAGYLVRKRKPGDARTNVVRLTADGEYAMRRNLSMAEQVDAELLAPLSQAERSKLRALLRRFSDFHKPQ